MKNVKVQGMATNRRTWLANICAMAKWKTESSDGKFQHFETFCSVVPKSQQPHIKHWLHSGLFQFIMNLHFIFC